MLKRKSNVKKNMLELLKKLMVRKKTKMLKDISLKNFWIN